MKRNAKLQTFTILLLCWLTATSFNLNKAYHIDDTAHLAIANAISQNPRHPMSVEVNWLEAAAPIHRLNQPHLFFYLMALTTRIFGESEVVLHLLVSLFSLIAVAFFYLLARNQCPKHATLLVATFSLGPAFIPSQNVMVDVPMAACWLVFFWALLANNSAREGPRLVLAALIASAACLIKYSSLVLLPILFLNIILRRKWRRLWVLLIPIAALATWSILNYFDYGGVHILSRETARYGFGRFFIRCAAWIICLGAISPFAIAYFPYLAARRSGWLLLSGCLLLTTTLFLLSFALQEEPGSSSALRATFLTNGLVSAGGVLFFLARGLRNPRAYSKDLLLLFWFLGAAAFVVLFSPTIAVRQLIVVVPVSLIVLGRYVLPKLSNRWSTAAFLASFALGTVLGISDWSYANVYREYAPKIKQRLDWEQRIWYVGHWGWQWYAARAGMVEYDRTVSRPGPGDFLVAPEMVDVQVISDEHRNSLVSFDEVTVESDFRTFFRVGPMAGFYSSSIRRLPWILSNEPVEIFKIYQFK